MTAARSMPAPNMATSRTTARCSLVIPASRAIRSQFRADVDAPRPRVGADERDDDRRAREREAPRGHEAVAAVVAGAAQDDDRATAPAVEVDGERLDGGRDGGARVLHEPLLGDAERLRAPVGARHRLRGDRRERGAVGPASTQAAQVEVEDRRVVGREGRGRLGGRGHRLRSVAERSSAYPEPGPATVVELDEAVGRERRQGPVDGRSVVHPDRRLDDHPGIARRRPESVHDAAAQPSGRARERGGPHVRAAPGAARERDAIRREPAPASGGQASQSAVAARQSVAPRSIRAWVHAPGWSRRDGGVGDPASRASGSTSDRRRRCDRARAGHSCPRRRPERRTRSPRRPCAVYGPTPGSVSSTATSEGTRPPCSRDDHAGSPPQVAGRAGRSRDPATPAGRRRASRPRGPRPSGTSR